MKIKLREVGNVTIIELEGNMTLGEGDEELGQHIQVLLKQGKNNILLKMTECPYIDSAGLGEIVRGFINLSRHGGKLKLLDLSKRIEDLLIIVKMRDLFEVFDNEEAALKSFS